MTDEHRLTLSVPETATLLGISRAHAYELAVRCLVLLAVAGDLLADLGARHRRSRHTADITPHALAELVLLCDQVAEAVAGLDRWELANSTVDDMHYHDPQATDQRAPVTTDARPWRFGVTGGSDPPGRPVSQSNRPIVSRLGQVDQQDTESLEATPTRPEANEGGHHVT
jgi:hypothetical protein